jgi:hypothetical protein
MAGLGPNAIGGIRIGRKSAQPKRLGCPRALALNVSRLLVLGIRQSIALGKGSDVKDLGIRAREGDPPIRGRQAEHANPRPPRP